jgi:hypothetical protein
MKKTLWFNRLFDDGIKKEGKDSEKIENNI